MNKVIKRNGVFELEEETRAKSAREARLSGEADLQILASQPADLEALRGIIQRILLRLGALEAGK